MSDRPCILITRPMPVAEVYARELVALGFDTVCAPMLEMREVAFAVPDLDGFQGLIFTSRQGVRMFSARFERRDMAVYCVGGNTADMARACGFENVRSADGDAGDLLACVQACAKAGDQFLHVCGRDVARDITPDFEGAGFVLEPLVVYAAEFVGKIEPSILADMEAKRVSAVVFFSRRTAQNFLRIVEREGAVGALGHLKALCISASVVECVRAELWGDVCVAPQANRQGMLTLLDDLL